MACDWHFNKSRTREPSEASAQGFNVEVFRDHVFQAARCKRGKGSRTRSRRGRGRHEQSTSTRTIDINGRRLIRLECLSSWAPGEDQPEAGHHECRGQPPACTQPGAFDRGFSEFRAEDTIGALEIPTLSDLHNFGGSLL